MHYPYKPNYIRDSISFFGLSAQSKYNKYEQLHVTYDFNDTILKVLSFIAIVSSFIAGGYASFLLSDTFSYELQSIYTVIIFSLIVYLIWPMFFFGIFRLLKIIKIRNNSDEEIKDAAFRVEEQLIQESHQYSETDISMSDIHKNVEHEITKPNDK
jgi:hypothetical protein